MPAVFRSALVVSGLLNSQIAELGIHEVMVKVRRGRVMRKMRAKSLAELVTGRGAAGASPAR